ncbi:putative ABC transport system permease protein [Paenibacillus cellulosilyticus]|uniref:Putative ABC transport system permease protein n=1 Tax=Paenibacillus cellulosilyticus TaxID=375489 RepID=A0A2V2YQ66_9BACL|nr:FtsX-like permease family protein [Paenibacillus cellulosilyticus]PWV98682.1 putative ABC transport system permease protein [Paenibacillus cellulosilyticus]QKS43814.1 FtsX-like permease family protein [Paenibacillus cellulosilyticus]
MRILLFLLLKMRQNRWFTLTTLLGLTVAVAFAMSIPMYADGTLKRVVAKSLEEQTQGLPAASLYLKYQSDGNDEADLEGLAEADRWVRETLPKRMGFPVEGYSSRVSLPASTVRPVSQGSGAANRLVRMELATQAGIPEGAELVDGKLPAEGKMDGVIEALVLGETMERYDWNVGDTFYYDAKNADGKVQRLTVRISGSYKLRDETNLSWAIDGKDKLASTLWVSNDTMTGTLLGDSNLVPDSAGWFYAFNLDNIRMQDLSPLIDELQRLEVTLHGMLADTKMNLTFESMLRDFQQQSVLLLAMLFALAAPVLTMALYFITLNAQQALERQRGVIAVLHSRGASPRQIIALYAIEAAILGLAALAIGACLAWFMAKVIGSSSGFLSFVGRKSIPVGISRSAWLLGGMAAVLAAIASTAPIRRYAESSVVQHAQQRSRGAGRPMWQRLYLDVVLLGLAGAGWYALHAGQLSSVSGADSEASIQPVIFVIPALFIFAAGLLGLRLFPLLLRYWNAMMRHRMPVTIYLTVTQLSRSAVSFYPIMLLLILTIGLGVYNSSAARTMDLNASDRTQYQYGADVVVKTAWEGVQDENDENRIYYSEPSFESFRQLDGVTAAARVYKATGKVEISGKSAGSGQLVGIDNAEFAQAAWFRNDLYAIHPYYYLDALGTAEQAVLVSQAFARKHGLKEGDPISLRVGYDNTAVDFVVVGIVPYWPSLYEDESPYFIANLDYIYQQIEKTPYEVWLNMDDGAKLGPVLDTLADRGVTVTDASDARSELVDRRSHPAQGGLFGILSLGFIITLLISLLGYLIFWLFSLSRRVVQLGILRATGLSRGQLTGMLLLEQLFTTGLSLAAGIGLGQAASRLFLPFLQGGGVDSERQVPPFRIVFEAEDALKLYAATGVMLAAGACLLVWQLRSLRITQAVKLGEER